MLKLSFHHTEASSLTREEKIAAIAHHFKEIIHILGLGKRYDLIEKTPTRIAEMYVDDIFSSLNPETYPSLSFTEEMYTATHQEMIFTKSHFTSFCEHHFLPMIGNVFVAYTPKKKIIGLSKIPRIIRFFAAQPQLQERLTVQVAKELSHVLETDHVAVLIKATHFCVIARGVRDEQSETVTSTLLGHFSTNKEKRETFYSSIDRNTHETKN